MADHAHNKRANLAAAPGRGRPLGVITRGTTGFNRLRKADRFLFYDARLRSLLTSPPGEQGPPLALDVGYGASFTTTCEWARWLRRIRPDVRVTGLEIDPQRVLPPREGVTFELGGFELAGYHPQVVRAFNVLRQYHVDQVEEAWATVCERLAPGGLFVEGTCDELGRRMAWILLDSSGPRELTLAWDPLHCERPSDVAERLPKVLIHRNVPGEPIHQLLREADSAWERCAGYAPFGPRVRWREARALLAEQGVPLSPIRRRVQDSLLTVPWELVAG